MIERLFGFFQIIMIFRIIFPGKIQHQVEVIIHHREIRCTRMHSLQFLNALLKHIFRRLWPFLGFGLLLHFLYLLRITVTTQFFLDTLQLLLQKVFPLLFVELGPGLGGYFIFQLGKL